MNVAIIKTVIVSAVLTYSIFPGKEIFQAIAVLGLIVSSILLCKNHTYRFTLLELLLSGIYFFICAISILLFSFSDSSGHITEIPWKSFLYPFTFLAALIVGRAIRLNMIQYHRLFKMLFWIVSISAVIAYFFPDIPLCNGTRPMVILPGDAACGLIDNPNYYSFTALALFFWFKITASLAEKGKVVSKLRLIDWDTLSLIGSSRMGLVVMLAQKSLIVDSWRTRIRFILVGAFFLLAVFLFSPSRLDFSIDERLAMWEFAWSFFLQHPGGVFAPEIYSDAMASSIGVNGEFQNSLFAISVIYGVLGTAFYLLSTLVVFHRARGVPRQQRVWALGILLMFVLNGLVRTHLPGGVGFISLSFGLLCGFVTYRDRYPDPIQKKTRKILSV